MSLTPHTFWLNARSHHISPAGEDLGAALKSRGIDARRSSRFTQLALLGAHDLVVPAESHIYLASTFHSPGTFLRNFRKLIEHDLPSPLDFMANLHNAAVFHVVQRLGCHGGSLFLAIDAETLWQPLWLGLNQLMQAPDSPVIIGWAYEAPPGQTQSEGSVWWQLGSRREHPHSLALTLAPAGDSAAQMPSAHFWPTLTEYHRRLGAHTLSLPPCGYPPAWRIAVQAADF